MNLSAQNIIEYIFHKAWENSILQDYDFFNDNLKIEQLDEFNVRNTIIKVSINNDNFIFKQPKQIINGASWPIINEARFYSFEQSITNCEFSSYFDTYRNILIVKYFEPISKNKILIAIPLISKKLREFHNYLFLESEVEIYAQKYLSATSNPYKDFLRILIKGHENDTFRDEVIFPALMNPNLWIRREILYNFLNQHFIFLGINKINEISLNSNLIHGDIKINNIGFKNETIYLFDFELVSKGDTAWDIACLLDSIFYSLFNKTYEKDKGISLFKNVVENYNENSINFFERVILFWAIKKIERFKTQNIRQSYFLKEIDSIKLFLEKSSEISIALSKDLNNIMLYL